jgi:hypothetical protein
MCSRPWATHFAFEIEKLAAEGAAWSEDQAVEEALKV